MKAIKLVGDHYAMGRQHGRQVRAMRPHIVEAMRRRLTALAQHEIDWQPYVTELVSAWEERSRPTLQMLHGIAEELALEWASFFRYTIASYLEDRGLRPARRDGCTVWAAARAVTRNGAPMLVKNRDYRPDHQPLQCIARAHPARGYRYTYVTSAGSPGVFSSGMNEAGLAVADTHVPSLDLGPGTARYSVMMELLEHHSTVGSALDYLREVTHVGDGTLVLTDVSGNIAVFEAGHSANGIVWPKRGFGVSTNHFLTRQLRDRWIDLRPPELRGNSQNRHAKVVAALQAARGRVDAVWAQQLMADHGGSRPTVAHRKQYAICRHSDIDPQSATISTALYLPQEQILLFANGQPCQVAFQPWEIVCARPMERARPRQAYADTAMVPASIPVVKDKNPIPDLERE